MQTVFVLQFPNICAYTYDIYIKQYPLSPETMENIAIKIFVYWRIAHQK